MPFRRQIRAAAMIAIGVLSLAAVGRCDNTGTPLDTGYAAMYNLQFDAAHRSFQQWEAEHPQDPLGPVSDAAAYLFDQFNRLHVLEIELFTDNNRFEGRTKQSPDTQLKQQFEAQLARGMQLADAALRRDPKDGNALFASTLALGLRGDYLAMVEKRDLQGLSYMKQGRALAERLIAADPSCYDAYLAVGVENYLLSLRPAPVRWILRIGGAETDKDTGLQKLRITADKGRYLRSYARLLLAVAAVRDHDKTNARALLAGLAQLYPQNPLYGEELARVK